MQASCIKSTSILAEGGVSYNIGVCHAQLECQVWRAIISRPLHLGIWEQARVVCLSFSTERMLLACPAGSISPWAVAKTNTGVLLACSIVLGL